MAGHLLCSQQKMNQSKTVKFNDIKENSSEYS